jgi:C1A family cysteine protease
MSQPATGPPPAIDLSGELLPVRSQGPRGTCLAFSVTTTHEQARARDGAGLEDLSEELLFWAAKQVDGDSDDSTTFESVEQALRSTGQPLEEHWPYDETRDIAAPGYAAPAAALDPANLQRADLLRITPTLEAVRSELAKHRTVALGIELWDDFAFPVSGHLATPDPAELNGEGHAVVAVGYDDRRQRLLLRNSWGRHWGTDGHATVNYDFVPQHLIAAWVTGNLIRDASPS